MREPELFQDTEIRAIVYQRKNATWSGAFHLSTLLQFSGETRTVCVFVGADYATETGAIHASLTAGRRAAVLFEQDL